MGGFVSPPISYRNQFVPPAAPAPAPAAQHAPAGSCGFDWGRVQYGEFRSDDKTVGQHAGIHISPWVISRPPRVGYYHEVLAFSCSGKGSNGFSYAAFLIPPQYADVTKIAGLMTFFGDGVGISPGPDAMPGSGIRLTPGAFLTPPTLQQGNHMGIFTPGDRLIIPPGWCVLVCRDDNQASSSSDTLLVMQLAFVEVQLGDDAAIF